MPASIGKYTRFSLRALLAAFVVFSLLLAVMLVPARKQRTALRELEERNCWFVFNTDYPRHPYHLTENSEVFEFDWHLTPASPPNVPSWLLNLMGPDCFRHVIYVSIRGPSVGYDPVGDEVLVPIGELKTIEGLNLTDSHTTAVGEPRETYVGENNITDVGLRSLGEMPRLTYLSLAMTRVTSEGMNTVARFRCLKKLDLSYTDVDDAGMAALATLPELESLILIETKVTDRGLLELASCRSLQWLSVIDADGVTDEGAVALQQRRPTLRIRTAKHVFRFQPTPTP